MGSDQFIPGNPADAKDVPEIEDLNSLNRHTTTKPPVKDQQREEEKNNDEVTKKAPSRPKEKQ